MANWQVIHYDHAGNALGESVPSELEFGYKHSELAYINYNLDKSDPLAVIGKTQTYVTDFVLNRDTVAMLGGLHTQVEADDVSGSTIKVSGKEWLHYFERRFYPYDGGTLNGYTAVGQDLFQIARDLINTTLAQPNSLTGVTFDAASLLASGITGDFRIEPADIENIYTKLVNVSEIDPGFDIDMSPAKVISLITPKRHNISSNFILELGTNVKSINYTDRGPDGNHLYASATRGSSTITVLLDSPGPASLWRRLDYDQNFSTVQTVDQLLRVSQVDIGRASTPVFDLVITINPNYFQTVWQTLRPGYTVRLIANIDYMQIDGNYEVVTMTGRLDKTGNESLELAFNA